MSLLVTITGATGKTGGALMKRLIERGVRVRAVARNAEKLALAVATGADARVGDLADRDFLAEAFRGSDAVFAMIPQRFHVADYEGDQRRLIASTTAAIETSAVSHVVALSTPAARLRVGLPSQLADFEDRLRAIPGLSLVLLLPMYYMDNFVASIPLIRSAGITGSAIRGDLPLPMIATRDVAAVAAEYLGNPVFEGHTEHPLLGPRDYTFREASSILGRAIGQPELPYGDFSYEDFRQGLQDAGFSTSSSSAFVQLARAYNEGRVQRLVSRDATNRTPTALEDFAVEVFAPAYQASHASSTAMQG